MLPRPFDGQITETRDPQAVRQMPIDCGFDEFGRQESQRYRHVDFAHAAFGAGGDAVGRGGGILDEFLEPMAPLGNCSNQGRFRLRPNGPPVRLRWVSGEKDFATPCWWGLAPRNVERVCVFGVTTVFGFGLDQFD